MERIGVFIDYENVHRVGHSRYGRADQALFETALDPRAIAERIVEKRRAGGELVTTKVFRGRPLPRFQPKATSANDMLAAAWAEDSVEVIRRDLKYVRQRGGTWSAQEKGIDVALAIGVVEAAMSGAVDVAALFGTDSDQVPTLELVFHRLAPSVEIACWTTAKPLWFPELLRQQPPRRMPYCDFLDEQDFVRCRDPRAGAHDRRAPRTAAPDASANSTA